MTSLNKQKKIIEKNIKSEKDIIKRGKTYTNLRNGMVFQPNHYKKAIKYDKKALAKVKAKIAIKDAAKKSYKSTPIGKLGKAYKVTKAGLTNFLKKKKK